ncbi:uncharacterized protein ASPGLDRAFT_1515210, partial [Aspergillus glaucus CBS 516.65]
KVLSCSWENLLLIFVPVGLAVNYTHQSPLVIFAINFVAIVGPSALLEFSLQSILSIADENESNALQLITSILLLKNNQVGSLLSNMHLMLGLGFLAGGLRYSEQAFNNTATQEIGTLLLLVVMSIVIPTLFHSYSLSANAKPCIYLDGLLSFCFFCMRLFVYFQIWSHKPQTALASIKERRINTRELRRALTIQRSPSPPRLLTAIIILSLATALIGLHSTFATDDLQNMMEQANLSRTFVGMVILPLLSNDLGPIKAAWENHIDRFIAATVGKCVQTALLVTPLVIFIAWGMGVKDVSLYFDGFEVATLFATLSVCQLFDSEWEVELLRRGSIDCAFLNHLHRGVLFLVRARLPKHI